MYYLYLCFLKELALKETVLIQDHLFLKDHPLQETSLQQMNIAIN